MRRSERDLEVLGLWVRSLASWEVFGTFTFKGEVGIQRAIKLFEAFMRANAQGISYFYSLEDNPGRKGCHIHAIFAGADTMSRRAVWGKWFRQHGRNRIEPIRTTNAVACYCAKYLVKESSWWMYKVFNQSQLALPHAR